LFLKIASLRSEYTEVAKIGQLIIYYIFEIRRTHGF